MRRTDAGPDAGAHMKGRTASDLQIHNRGDPAPSMVCVSMYAYIAHVFMYIYIYMCVCVYVY